MPTTDPHIKLRAKRKREANAAVRPSKRRQINHEYIEGNLNRLYKFTKKAIHHLDEDQTYEILLDDTVFSAFYENNRQLIRRFLTTRAISLYPLLKKFPAMKRVIAREQCKIDRKHSIRQDLYIVSKFYMDHELEVYAHMWLWRYIESSNEWASQKFYIPGKIVAIQKTRGITFEASLNSTECVECLLEEQSENMPSKECVETYLPGMSNQWRALQSNKFVIPNENTWNFTSAKKWMSSLYQLTLKRNNFIAIDVERNVKRLFELIHHYMPVDILKIIMGFL